jgi:hypothetical protein
MNKLDSENLHSLYFQLEVRCSWDILYNVLSTNYNAGAVQITLVILTGLELTTVILRPWETSSDSKIACID